MKPSHKSPRVLGYPKDVMTNGRFNLMTAHNSFKLALLIPYQDDSFGLVRCSGVNKPTSANAYLDTTKGIALHLLGILGEFAVCDMCRKAGLLLESDYDLLSWFVNTKYKTKGHNQYMPDVRILDRYYEIKASMAGFRMVRAPELMGISNTMKMLNLPNHSFIFVWIDRVDFLDHAGMFDFVGIVKAVHHVNISNEGTPNRGISFKAFQSIPENKFNIAGVEIHKMGEYPEGMKMIIEKVRKDNILYDY